MIEDDLVRLESICAAATPGPWTTFNSYSETLPEVVDQIRDPSDDVVVYIPAKNQNDRSDAEFIATARAAMPAVLAEVRRLQREVELRIAVRAHACFDHADNCMWVDRDCERCVRGHEEEKALEAFLTAKAKGEV